MTETTVETQTIDAIGLHLDQTFEKDPSATMSDLMPVGYAFEELQRWGAWIGADPQWYGVSERDRKFFASHPGLRWYLRPATEEEITQIGEVKWPYDEACTPDDPYWAVFVVADFTSDARLLLFVCFAGSPQDELTEPCMLVRTQQPRFHVLFDPTEY
jgi:hypothetical protein